MADASLPTPSLPSSLPGSTPTVSSQYLEEPQVSDVTINFNVEPATATSTSTTALEGLEGAGFPTSNSHSASTEAQACKSPENNIDSESACFQRNPGPSSSRLLKDLGLPMPSSTGELATTLAPPTFPVDTTCINLEAPGDLQKRVLVDASRQTDAAHELSEFDEAFWQFPEGRERLLLVRERLLHEMEQRVYAGEFWISNLSSHPPNSVDGNFGYGAGSRQGCDGKAGDMGQVGSQHSALQRGPFDQDSRHGRVGDDSRQDFERNCESMRLVEGQLSAPQMGLFAQDSPDGRVGADPRQFLDAHPGTMRQAEANLLYHRRRAGTVSCPQRKAVSGQQSIARQFSVSQMLANAQRHELIQSQQVAGYQSDSLYVFHGNAVPSGNLVVLPWSGLTPRHPWRI
ncbi:hypothetical protein BJ508DRAFT_332542 [Ascobolus immersus RN42]|uniref:Uncharacterized protein n=1 Tax=Ascobolus immersus RN42 TaxID=1160509 RepID=A0A3N4HT30_ASCIM|nr:hypothetical protein BJ508DRAFT_332542 [Ascobolus immersus RN42]